MIYMPLITDVSMPRVGPPRPVPAFVKADSKSAPQSKDHKTNPSTEQQQKNLQAAYLKYHGKTLIEFYTAIIECVAHIDCIIRSEADFIALPLPVQSKFLDIQKFFTNADIKKELISKDELALIKRLEEWIVDHKAGVLNLLIQFPFMEKLQQLICEKSKHDIVLGHILHLAHAKSFNHEVIDYLNEIKKAALEKFNNDNTVLAAAQKKLADHHERINKELDDDGTGASITSFKTPLAELVLLHEIKKGNDIYSHPSRFILYPELPASQIEKYNLLLNIQRSRKDDRLTVDNILQLFDKKTLPDGETINPNADLIGEAIRIKTNQFSSESSICCFCRHEDGNTATDVAGFVKTNLEVARLEQLQANYIDSKHLADGIGALLNGQSSQLDLSDLSASLSAAVNSQATPAWIDSSSLLSALVYIPLRQGVETHDEWVSAMFKAKKRLHTALSAGDPEPKSKFIDKIQNQLELQYSAMQVQKSKKVKRPFKIPSDFNFNQDGLDLSCETLFFDPRANATLGKIIVHFRKTYKLENIEFLYEIFSLMRIVGNLDLMGKPEAMKTMAVAKQKVVSDEKTAATDEKIIAENAEFVTIAKRYDVDPKILIKYLQLKLTAIIKKFILKDAEKQINISITKANEHYEKGELAAAFELLINEIIGILQNNMKLSAMRITAVFSDERVPVDPGLVRELIDPLVSKAIIAVVFTATRSSRPLLTKAPTAAAGLFSIGRNDSNDAKTVASSSNHARTVSAAVTHGHVDIKTTSHLAVITTSNTSGSGSPQMTSLTPASLSPVTAAALQTTHSLAGTPFATSSVAPATVVVADAGVAGAANKYIAAAPQPLAMTRS